MLVLALQTLKVGGHFRVLRGRRNTLEACQYQCVVFAWQAQHFVTCVVSVNRNVKERCGEVS